MKMLSDVLVKIDDFVWGPVMLILVVGTGVFLTIRTKALCWRNLPYALRSVLSKEARQKKGEGDVSPFSALTTALAATIGTGNIVGVATAMVSGGPGALVWMWISAAFGLTSKFSECMLAIKYREVNEKGEMSGGPMYTMKKGFKNKKFGAVLGWLFALFAVIASFGIGNLTQGNSISSALDTTFGVPLFSSGLQGLFHACGLAELVFVLIHGLAGVHAAGSAHGVAAHHGLALQDDNALALAGSGDGSSHTCAACANDDDIGVDGGILSLGVLSLDCSLVVVGVQACCHQSGSCSLLDGVGGDGSARDAIHSDAAGLSDLAGQLLQSQGTNALGLVGTLSGAAGNLAVGQGQGDGHVAAHALCGAGKVTGDTCSRGGGVALCAAAEQAQGHDGCQCKRSNAFSHDWIFLPSSWCLLHSLSMRTSISIKRGSCAFGTQLPLCRT